MSGAWDAGCHRIELNGGLDALYYRFSVGGTVEIVELYVRSERRVGIGRRLVAELKNVVRKSCTSIYVFTRYNNWIARQFYEAVGFKFAGVLRGMYRDGTLDEEDAVMFVMDMRGK